MVRVASRRECEVWCAGRSRGRVASQGGDDLVALLHGFGGVLICLHKGRQIIVLPSLRVETVATSKAFGPAMSRIPEAILFPAVLQCAPWNDDVSR